MANSNPSAEQVRDYYDEQRKSEALKVKDKSFIDSAKEEFGIDLEEFNAAIDKGEFDL